MDTSATTTPTPQPTVTLSQDGQLYVIPCGSGYTCLGIDVLIRRYNALAAELAPIPPFPLALRGTLEGYARYQALMDQARATGRRFLCELSPSLIGHEGRRVEVVDLQGERRRFIVGRSTGWLPIHLEIKTRRSLGGMAADRLYQSVRDIGPGR
jgi:hypothetical protein